MSSNTGINQVSRQQLDEFAAGKRSSVSCTTYGRADGMESAESGAVIRFNRGVVLTLDPAKTSEAAK